MRKDLTPLICRQSNSSTGIVEDILRVSESIFLRHLKLILEECQRAYPPSIGSREAPPPQGWPALVSQVSQLEKKRS